MGPTGPAGESEMVRARGEDGQDWSGVSQLLASEPVGPGFLPCPPQQHLFPFCSPSPSPAGRPIVFFVLGTLQFRT